MTSAPTPKEWGLLENLDFPVYKTNERSILQERQKEVLELYIKASKKQIKRLEERESVKRYNELKRLVKKATKYYFELS